MLVGSKGNKLSHVNVLFQFSRHLCPTASKELEELHYDALNQAYNTDVLDLWKSGGCYSEIHRRLGYRIQLNRVMTRILDWFNS